MITREQLVRIARDAAGGLNRPPNHCEGSYTTPWGTTETVTIECEHTVRNPASYDPPEWILDAMRRAYLAGKGDGQVAALRIALANAIQQCKLHNEEHGHVTPNDVIDGWRSLLEPGGGA